MKNGLYTRICKKAFVFIVVLLVFGVAIGFASLNIYKIKADTQFYEDLSQYVVNDWENYTTETKNNMTLTNNADGTITLNGTASATTEFVLPITTPNTNGRKTVFLALLYNNLMYAGTTVDNTRLYLAYNNGANITSTYSGSGTSSSYSILNLTQTNYCLVLRIAENRQYSNVIFTPFCMIIDNPGGSGQFDQSLSKSQINALLGPSSSNIDLTKVNYIQQAQNISLAISSQINKSFGNELEELMQYTMQAGDEITVDNAGVASTEIDLLTMTAGLDIYKMTFVNDALSNNYNNILLYYNNNATIFYNDNLGELSAQNITDFRVWASMAINANATITSASANNNNILNKIFVYSTGTNYELGYTAGYNDARQDVEEELQEAYGEGLSQGYGDGYTTGYGEGYDQGAIEGVDSSWLINLFGAIDAFFAIHLFPNLTFGTIFAIPFVLSIAWVIIRILRGGGYGD